MIVREFASGPLQTRAYLVADPAAGEALVVDPGCETGALLGVVARQGLRVTAIVNTHGHFDHVSGNRAVREATGAPVMIHRADALLATRAAAIAALFGFAAEDSPAPDVLLAEEAQLRAGDLRFFVQHTPGHTPGSISLYGHGALFCGDLLVDGAPGRTALSGCDEALLERSIERCFGPLAAQTIVYAGHNSGAPLGEAFARPAAGHRA